MERNDRAASTALDDDVGPALSGDDATEPAAGQQANERTTRHLPNLLDGLVKRYPPRLPELNGT